MNDSDLLSAQLAAAEHRWKAAAEAYERHAIRAQTAVAWDAAGEAWRRADLPGPAAEALRRAIALQDLPISRIKLAGILGELGEAAEAQAVIAAAFDASEGPLRALAADTAFEAEIALGRKEPARALVPVIRELAVGEARLPLELTVAFREGQLLRLDGLLTEAVAHYGRVVASGLQAPEAAPARAAAESELAEVALLFGDAGDALALYSQAKVRFEAMGRQSLAWKCESGRVRAAVEAGENVDLAELDRALTFARQHGHRVFAVDVQIARGMVLGRGASDAAFQEAIAEADEMGHPWRAGRARVSWARAGGKVPLEALEKAVSHLEGHLPWQVRARWALAMAQWGSARSKAKSAAMSALARFEAMGMAGDVAEARVRVAAEITG